MKNRQIAKGKMWLRQQTRPYRGRVVLLSIYTFFISLLAVAFACLVRYLINAATDKKYTALLVFSFVLIALLLVRIFFQAIKIIKLRNCVPKLCVG